MKIFVSESGVASTIVRMFEDNSGIDIRNKISDLRGLRTEYEDAGGLKTRFTFFLDSDITTALHLRTASLFQSNSVESYSHIKDFLQAILDSHDIHFINNEKVYRLP